MKTLSSTLLLLVLLLAIPSAHAQSVAEVCAMSTSAVTSTCQLAGLTLAEPLNIPVVVHVIASASGSGDVSLAVIEEQIDVLNEAFDEFEFYFEEARFQFELVGVGRVQNDTWHTMQFSPDDITQPEGQAKQSLHVDPESVLNIYIANPNFGSNGAAFGWSTFPFSWIYQGQNIFYPESHFMHGIVVDYNTLPGGSEPTQEWDDGDNASHETGHYLGLYHTWGETCTDEGDCVDDTAIHRAYNSSCSGTQSCNQNNPIHNLMNYADDACRYKFTEGQFDRMDQVVSEYKPALAQGLPAPLILDEEDGDVTSPVIWTNETFEGEDLYILGGAAVSVPAGSNVVLKADAQGNPTTLYVNGTLTGEENITLLDGSEIVCRYASNCDIGGGLTASGTSGTGAGACILARKGGTVKFSGTSSFSSNGFFVNDGGTVVLDDYAVLDMASSAGRFEAAPGSQFRFGEGSYITIGGRADIEGTATDPVVFEGDNLFPYQRWGGLAIEGDDALVRHAEIADATIGIDLRAHNATFDYLTLSGNVTGLATDYAECKTTCTRSTFSLESSTITGSDGVGLYLRNADTVGRRIEQNTISDNGGHGISVWNSDIGSFSFNVVEGNGNGTAGSPANDDGIAVLAGGDLELSQVAGVSGYNRIAGNTDDQLSIASGGYLFVGSYGSGQNTIQLAAPSAKGNASDGKGSSEEGRASSSESRAPDNPYLIENNSTPKVYARYTYWGSPSGPPSGAFGGSGGLVVSSPYLTSDPTGAAGAARPEGPGKRSASVSPIAAKTGEGGPRGDGDLRGDDLEWLRERILHVRGLLTDGPVAPGLIRRLYGLQRLDRADVLGERAATMALLATIRAVLDSGTGGNPGAARKAAEAALGAALAAAVRDGDYDAAERLATQYAPVIAATEERDLALVVAALDEQAGRYAEAVARIEAVIASLEEAEAALAADLAAVAALVAAKADGEGRGVASATASAKGNATALPSALALHPAYPNPTASGATVPFDLPEACDVRVAVYDVLGREVAVLAEGWHGAGRHRAVFETSGLASGLYVVRARFTMADGVEQNLSQRITLIE